MTAPVRPLVRILGSITIMLGDLDVAGGCHWQRLSARAQDGRPLECHDFRLEDLDASARAIRAVLRIVPREHANLERALRRELEGELAHRRAA